MGQTGFRNLVFYTGIMKKWTINRHGGRMIITLLFIKMYLSLFFERGSNLLLRGRDISSGETTEGFGHCFIDPYLLLCRVVLNLAFLLNYAVLPYSYSGPHLVLLLNHTVLPYSYSGPHLVLLLNHTVLPYLYSGPHSISFASQPGVTRGPLWSAAPEGRPDTR